MNGNENNNNGNIFGGADESEHIRRHHTHDVADHQCSDVLTKHIRAPVHLVICLFYLLIFVCVNFF